MVDMISSGTLPCAASGCGSGNGQVKLSLSYASQDRQLIVIVHACRYVSSDIVSNTLSQTVFTPMMYCWPNHSYLRVELRKILLFFSIQAASAVLPIYKFFHEMLLWHNLNISFSFEKLTMLQHPAWPNHNPEGIV